MHTDMWSGVSRRSRRTRSGRSVHRRDTKRSISGQSDFDRCAAAKQREHHAALFAGKAKPEQGRLVFCTGGDWNQGGYAA